MDPETSHEPHGPPGAASPARGEGGHTRGRTLGEGGEQGKVRGQGPAMRNPAGESSFSIHFWVGFSLTKTNQLLGVVFFHKNYQSDMEVSLYRTSPSYDH